MDMRRVLLVDDEPTVRFGIRKFLERRGFAVDEAASCQEAREALAARFHSAAIFDHRLPDGTSLDLLHTVSELGLSMRVIVLTAHGTIDLAVESMKLGASNFLTKPVDLQTLTSLLDARPAPDAGEPPTAIEAAGPSGSPGSSERSARDPFLGTSRAIRTLEERARKLCRSGSPVLLMGETGTGKGVLARWLHDHGSRRDGPFLDLNCGGLNRELLESELFGYKQGAFTGAHKDKPGLLESAEGGTVFLDEIGDADPNVQVKLLKVLEERKVRRLGEVRERAIDFRLLAATHWDLPDRIRTGRFRKDLYYRISVLPLVIPPLRERTEDLPALARAMLERLDRRTAPELAPSAIERLAKHRWPGNLRELRNVLERAALLCEDGAISADDIQLDAATAEEPPGDSRADELLTLEETEIRHIRHVLREVDGNVSRAAEKLDVPRSSLYQKLKRYGLRP
jgi:DNA-binding NtrC family response regulator